jgi:hypothetical protein
LVSAPSDHVDRELIMEWVLDALRINAGEARIVQIARHIWEHHEAELRRSGDRFFTWQYDMRWAGKVLRDRGLMKPATQDGVWELSARGHARARGGAPCHG